MSSNPSIPTPVLGRTADGHLAAAIGDTALAALPSRSGLCLAYGSALTRPIELWTVDDFYGRGRILADEAEFRRAVDEQYRHQVERSQLDRPLEQGTAHTPWGPAQWTRIYAPGIRLHSTAGHGGFELAPDRNQLVHESLRISSGWYEEDSDWVAVVVSFPELFTSLERQDAERTLRNWNPDAWERIHGRKLEPGESRERDHRVWLAEHADDFIVIAASSSKRTGYVDCTATKGGLRTGRPHLFLVPKDEYTPHPFGFVIDPLRHEQRNREYPA